MYGCKVYRSRRFKWLTTSDVEIRHLLKAWLLISIAFAILESGLKFSLDFLIILVISAITVGIGFMLHELGHKVVAQKYHCLAEFRADDRMLFLAVVMSFFGFIFLAPGAVYIQGHVTQRKNGIISVFGPLMNYLLAIAFLLIMIASPGPLLGMMAGYGFSVNAWIGIFNLIPFGNFDGIKILNWSKLAYAGMVALGLGLMGVNYLNGL